MKKSNKLEDGTLKFIRVGSVSKVSSDYFNTENISTTSCKQNFCLRSQFFRMHVEVPKVLKFTRTASHADTNVTVFNLKLLIINNITEFSIATQSLKRALHNRSQTAQVCNRRKRKSQNSQSPVSSQISKNQFQMSQGSFTYYVIS